MIRSNSSGGSEAQGHYPRKPSENPADPRRTPQETPQSRRRDPRRAPRESFEVIFYLLPRKAKITLQGKNNLANVTFMLVLKGVFGGSLKITLRNKNNPQGKKWPQKILRAL